MQVPAAPSSSTEQADELVSHNAVLVGRSNAADNRSFSQHEAALDALGSLNVPIIAAIECGHVPPYMPIVNGAYGRIVHTPSRSELTQSLD
nr:hypothetical protein [Streptomyces acidicola]